MREAIQIAAETGQPIGKVLIVSDYIKEAHLQAALYVQTLLNAGSITESTGINALMMLAALNISI